MQHFRDNEKKQLKMSAILNFISVNLIMGYPCASPFFLFPFVLYAWSSYFALIFELRKYHKITQIQNGR